MQPPMVVPLLPLPMRLVSLHLVSALGESDCIRGSDQILTLSTVPTCHGAISSTSAFKLPFRSTPTIRIGSTLRLGDHSAISTVMVLSTDIASSRLRKTGN